MLTAVVEENGNIIIPARIRTAMDLKANDQVVFVRRRDHIIIKPLRDLASLRGVVPVTHEQDFESIRKQVRQKVAKRIANE